MKRFFCITIALIVLSTCVLGLTSCGGREGQATFTLIIGEKTYTVTTEQTTVHGAVEEMKDRGIITVYEYSGTRFSPFITAIDLIRPSKATEFVALYHDIEDAALYMYGSDFSVVTMTVNDKTYYCSGVGIALLPVLDGATYYIFIDDYSGSF